MSIQDITETFTIRMSRLRLSFSFLFSFFWDRRPNKPTPKRLRHFHVLTLTATNSRISCCKFSIYWNFVVKTFQNFYCKFSFPFHLLRCQTSWWNWLSSTHVASPLAVIKFVHSAKTCATIIGWFLNYSNFVILI